MIAPKKLRSLLRYIRAQQEKDNDTTAIVSGPKGTGKSTVAFTSGLHYLKTYGLRCHQCNDTFISTNKIVTRREPLMQPCPRCTSTSAVKPIVRITKDLVWKYMAYDNQDFYDKTFTLEEMSPIIGDEAVNFALAEEWAKVENRRIRTRMAVIRPQHYTFFLNIPEFTWVHRKIRDDMTDFWLYLVVKGRGACLNRFITNDDKWEVEEVKKKLKNITKVTPDEVVAERMQKLHKLKNFLGTFQWSALDKHIYDMYLEWRKDMVSKRTELQDEPEQDPEKDLTKMKLCVFLYNLRAEGHTVRWMHEHMIHEGKPLLAIPTIYNYIKDGQRIVEKAPNPHGLTNLQPLEAEP